MKFLSIDFDFFQDVSEETVRRYPDGIDLPTEATAIVWASRYAQYPELLDVKLKTEEYEQLLGLLKKQSRNSSVLIANSHKHIYTYIKEVNKTSDIDIVNIDMHHDMFNDNPEVDCGNWLGHIKKEYNASVRWIANPISLKVYGFKKDELDEAEKIISYSIKDIFNEKFDAIFLCRSDTWTPPHLDSYFTVLCNLLSKKFVEVKAEKKVLESREYKPLVDDIQKQISCFSS